MKIYAVKIVDINEDKLLYLCSSIDLEKNKRIVKFIDKKDKIRTLIGDILVRIIIANELNINNECIIFDKNQYGKPYLKNYPKFHFNISHSGDFVVCAIDKNPIGIDIEKIKYIEYRDIAKRYFTMNESKYIIEKDLSAQLTRFYEIWTLKESYIKCIGQGLSIPLKSFSINMDKYKNIESIEDYENNRYFLKLLELDLNYKIAVCSLNKEILDNIDIIDQSDLINKYLKYNLD
ncbi:4'-phosphopantetheinyl transferase superfamily protein [Clostridium sp. D2Q-14]|uniref:4'-phosphopantetheinyl transferase family protein n=1 Tax=Anaeromonas gelatinilytica TaxID=2683194 RepID=UPI00193BCC05|nr:4'-phosphopantetheinyl transferase superfamily protein [Anaeromonas gelatinilytica]MBS4536683.1 4'-phosphopantetheinyl transferase superfamily protein [Anaeromonas gelatinilytica]